MEGCSDDSYELHIAGVDRPPNLRVDNISANTHKQCDARDLGDVPGRFGALCLDDDAKGHNEIGSRKTGDERIDDNPTETETSTSFPVVKDVTRDSLTSKATNGDAALHAHAFVADLPQSSTSCNVENIAPEQPLLVCDCSYGFPTQKRPRRERINAVARQIANYCTWVTASAGNAMASGQDEGLSRNNGPTLVIVGRDLDALRGRLEALNVASCVGMFEGTLPGFLVALDRDKSAAVYLSPEGGRGANVWEQQDARSVFVVGGLVDRSVKQGRSQKRAADIGMECVRLPLNASVELSTLTASEPLNIDTVLETLHRWQTGQDIIDAVVGAVNTHRVRHPKRPQHIIRE